MRMKLNKTSYVHKKIRMLCFQLEQFTNLKMITDLSEEFTQIRFMNSLSYIIIDFKRNTCFSMSCKLDCQEFDIVQEILIYLNWLHIGEVTMNKLNKKSSRKH